MPFQQPSDEAVIYLCHSMRSLSPRVYFPFFLSFYRIVSFPRFSCSPLTLALPALPVSDKSLAKPTDPEAPSVIPLLIPIKLNEAKPRKAVRGTSTPKVTEVTEVTTHQQVTILNSTVGDSTLYWCSTCQRTYHTKTGLNQHKKFECNKEPQFLCTTCGRKFNRKSSLKRHSITLHNVLYPIRKRKGKKDSGALVAASDSSNVSVSTDSLASIGYSDSLVIDMDVSTDVNNNQE